MTDTRIPFLDDNDQTRARRDHLEAIRALVGNAYPNKFQRTATTANAEGEDTITSVVEEFKAHEPQIPEGAKPQPEQLQEANDELNKIEVRVSGRLATPPRVMGKVAFVHLSDGKSRLQIYVRKDETRAVSNNTGAIIDENESGWRLFQLLDHGDFIGVSGFLFVTKTGELSVHVRELQFLSKALVPMPDKMHGISDPETGRRQRYADLIASSLKLEREEGELTTREVFELRSRLITQMRSYLDAHGYVEVETPMLTPIASGAAARPFKTHHNALDIDLYARIAPELYLKRLLVGGFERVYELNRNFRNEGLGYRWNPEFTMLEFYCAYMDVNGMMDFCEKMLQTTIARSTGRLRLKFGDDEINFESGFDRLSMKQAVVEFFPSWYTALGSEQFEIAWLDDSLKLRQLAYALAILMTPQVKGLLQAEAKGKLTGTDFELRDYWLEQKEKVWRQTTEGIISNAGKVQIILTPPPLHIGEVYQVFKMISSDESEYVVSGHLLTWLFETVSEYQISKPTFITDFPKAISPLSKASPADPAVAERFELYVPGMEIANGFSELNDPVEQYERFEDQARQRERGDDEAMQMDVDYVRALSYGMPPAAGIGIGIDRLVMLLTNKKSIRDVILFPHMRPQAPKSEEAEQPDGTDEQSNAGG